MEMKKLEEETFVSEWEPEPVHAKVSYCPISNADYDDDWDGVTINAVINGKSYKIHAVVGIDEEGNLFRIDRLDDHAAEYVVDVEDSSGEIYYETDDAPDGLSWAVIEAILKDAIPSTGWSSDDVGPRRA